MRTNEEAKTLATENRMITESQIRVNDNRSKSYSKTREDDEVQKNRSFFDKLIISESSKWKAIFDIIVLLLVGYSCITSIFYVAFSAPTNLLHIIFDW